MSKRKHWKRREGKRLCEDTTRTLSHRLKAGAWMRIGGTILTVAANCTVSLQVPDHVEIDWDGKPPRNRH